MDRRLDVSDQDAETQPEAVDPRVEPALSANMLRDLLRLGEDFFAQLAENFLAEGPRRIERLRSLLEKGDFDTLATTAHGLASIAGTVAAVRLTELCYHLEKLARKRVATDCPAALRKLEAGFELAAAELREKVPAGSRTRASAEEPEAKAFRAAR